MARREIHVHFFPKILLSKSDHGGSYWWMQLWRQDMNGTSRIIPSQASFNLRQVLHSSVSSTFGITDLPTLPLTPRGRSGCEGLKNDVVFKCG